MVTTTADLFSIETVRELIVKPLFLQSVALQTLRRLETSSSRYYLPKVGLGDAAFVAELDELTDADVDASMLEVVPKKVGAVQIVSSESADDANAAQIIGAAIVAGLADRVDHAFFVGDDPIGPAGLPGIVGVTDVDADPQASLDPYSDAVAEIEAVGGKAGAIYMSPATWAALAKLKTNNTDSAQPVLSPQGGIDQAQQRALFGVAVHVSRHVEDDTAWVVDTTRTVAILRVPFTAKVDTSVKFLEDGVAVRAIGRVEFASVYPQTVAKITPGS